jgi:uncharacterized protein (DUF2141 family)
MRSKLAIFAVALALSPAARAADAATLTVKILNVTDKGGDLRIGVYDKATFVVRGSKPVTGQVVPAVPGTMNFTFSGLKPGEYGVKVLQDVNRNGKMDVSILAMKPAEPFGLSNDAKPSLSGPPWDDAKLSLHAGSNSATITLH